MLAVKRALKQFQPKIQEAANRISSLIGKTLEFFFDWDEFMKSSTVNKEEKPKIIELVVERYIPNIEAAITEIVKEKPGQKVMSVIEKIIIRIITNQTDVTNFSFTFEDEDTTLVFNVLPAQMYYSSSGLVTPLKKLLDNAYNLNVWDKQSQAKPIIDEFKKKFTQLIGVEEVKFNIKLNFKEFLKSESVSQDDKGKIFDLTKDRYLPNIYSAFQEISQDLIGKNIFKNISKLTILIHVDSTTQSNFSFTLDDQLTTLVFHILAKQIYYSSSGLARPLRKILDDNYNLNILLALEENNKKITQFAEQFSKLPGVEDSFQIFMDVQQFLFSQDVSQDDKGKIYSLATDRYLPNILKAYQTISETVAGQKILSLIPKLVLRVHTESKDISNFSFSFEDDDKTIVFHILAKQIYYSSSGLERSFRAILDNTYNLNIWESSSKYEPIINGFSQKFAECINSQNPISIRLEMKAFLKSESVPQDNKGKVFQLISERFLPNIYKAYETIAVNDISKQALQLFHDILITFVPKDASKSNFSFEYDPENSLLIFNIVFDQIFYSSSGLERPLRTLLNQIFYLNIKLEIEQLQPALQEASLKISQIISNPFYILVEYNQLIADTSVDVDQKASAIKLARERYLPKIISPDSGIPHVCRDSDGIEAMQMFTKFIITFDKNDQVSNFQITMDENEGILYFWVKPSQIFYSPPSNIANLIEKLL
ncbi:hypothetical protein M0811_02971 [Anaeramoeba ignava]|uniref:Uncharacterized protein n=1 Tax=Anaeramoeba ignava TaxID=1746090 RepID=A0A9Q0R620_ANAIG|nr:hypothetical protein M0811_02971 [Anaeramoeba ignava]